MYKTKKGILKRFKGKDQGMYKCRHIKITPDSVETLKTRTTWVDVLQILRDHRCQPKLVYVAKLSAIMEKEKS